MSVEKFIALGKNGVVEEIYNVKDRPADYIKVRKEKGTPLIELASDYFSTRMYVIDGKIITSDEEELTFLNGLAESIFADWGKFGYYGDVIQFTCNSRDMGPYAIHGSMNRNIDRAYTIDYIGRLVFPKGTLAVDLLPFFIDKNGREFFVGITLGKEGPNYGKPALIGGHIDHTDGYFESAAEAIIHEAEEEAGIILLPNEEEEIGKNPIPGAFEAELDLGGRRIETYVSYMGAFRTAENRNVSSGKNKRVDWTIAYYMVTEVDFDLSEEVLRQMFKAGSYAKDLLIVPAGVNDPLPEFVHDHHREIFIEARERKDRKVRGLRKIN